MERIRSDHRPLFIQAEPDTQSPRVERPFRFLVAWIPHEEFSRVMETAWPCSTHLPHSLEKLSAALKDWNHRLFGNIFHRKQALVRKLRRLEE
ncbi:unnamed protein product [Linum trigynum]|uniref:Reverse transcriptase n=1 Tax=Linum trigynum TaxID=586398 RepID=A0AAV2F7J7_9ROSI